MKKLVSINLLALGLAIAGCKDPSKDAPAAEATEPTAEAGEAAAGVEAAGNAIAVNQAHGSLGFVGSKVTGSHEGAFGKFDGKFFVEGESADKLAGEFTIDVASLKTDSEKLDGHLKSADFFDTETHPTAKFAIREVKASEGGKSEVTGELTLRGVTKAITFPADVKVAGDSIGLKSEFSINRKDFGIVYKGMPDDLIRDGVVIKIDLTVPRAS